MDLYFLNYKHILVVLTDKKMRQVILDKFERQEIDVIVKFADSYLKAAKMMEANKSEPFTHVIINLSYSNQKLKDFIEYIMPQVKNSNDFLLEYTNEEELVPVTISQTEVDE